MPSKLGTPALKYIIINILLLLDTYDTFSWISWSLSINRNICNCAIYIIPDQDVCSLNKHWTEGKHSSGKQTGQLERWNDTNLFNLLVQFNQYFADGCLVQSLYDFVQAFVST